MPPVRPAADPLTEVGRARRRLRDRPLTSRSIHEARRSLRRARALLKLGRGTAMQRSCRRADAACRRAARALAPVRDARAFAAMLDDLLKRGADDLPREALALGRGLAARARTAEARALSRGGAVRRANAALRACPRGLGGGPFASAVSPSLKDALRRARRRSRRRCLAARSSSAEEDFHDLRKAAKTLLHELEWLTPRRGAPPSASLDGLRELVKILGREHDLALLRGRLKKRPADAARDALLRLASKRQKRLRRLALKVAGQCVASE